MSTIADDPVDAIMQVMESAFDPAFGEAWTRRQISDALVLPSTHYLLARPTGASESGGVAGFILSRHVLDEEEVLLIAIAPQFRRRGIGRQLLTKFIEQAKSRGVCRVFLEMRDGNPAEGLYSEVGFERIGLRKGYYRGAIGGPIDAITFGRDI